MLLLDRRRNEQIVIGEDIVITVLEIKGSKVRLGITCPQDVLIHRGELLDPNPPQEPDR